MLTWLFLRKADFKKIKNILEKENFIFTEEDIKNLLKGNQKGTRYGNIVLLRKEGTEFRKRFLKLVLDGKWRTYKLFRRQVEVTSALSKDSSYNFPKLSVESSSLKPPVPYAVFETREEGEYFGFMHDLPKYYEKFNETDVATLAQLIYGFHSSGSHMDDNVLKHTQKISSEKGDYIKEINGYLDKKVHHKFSNGSEAEETIEKLLEKYTNISDLRSRVLSLFEKSWNFVENSKDKIYLVHADMALDNVYRHQNGKLEPLDFEWVGHADNPVIPIMYDYGNLRARAWSSKTFQTMLDKVMFEEGKKYYREEIIRAGLNLGILRSGLMMCRYHMDYKHTTRNDKRSDEDYSSMVPSTVSSIENLLKSNY